MATIAINGTDLLPQPAQARWEDTIIDGKLAGTEALGAYKTFRIQAPILAGQTFNWDTFENQVLTSLQAFAPADRPSGSNVIYNSGVVSRKIKTYQSPEDRTVTGIELEISVIV